MAKIFISFRGEDQFRVFTLRGLAEFKNVTFEWDDVSLREAIKSRDENYIKGVIRPKIHSCDMCLCMIGENTHKSRNWIPWEITLAIGERKEVIAMRFKNSDNAITPKILMDNYIVPFNWDVDKLFKKINS